MQRENVTIVNKYPTKEMDWLFGRRSELSIHNKLLLEKQVLKPCRFMELRFGSIRRKLISKFYKHSRTEYILRTIVYRPLICQ